MDSEDEISEEEEEVDLEAFPEALILVPPEASSFEGFRAWSQAQWFPMHGRIDFVAGSVDIELNPEDLFTHGTAKIAIGSSLHFLVTRQQLGEVFMGGARVASPSAAFSVEPDVVVVLWDSLRSGVLRYVPTPGHEPERYIQMEGAPDLIVEIVSDDSVHKDTEVLPPLYARAGVPELWLTDARGKEIDFQILTLEDGGYVPMQPDADGWLDSPRLGLSFRLTRYRTPFSTWSYTLEQREG
jgi:Uma2 family endonuclease